MLINISLNDGSDTASSFEKVAATTKVSASLMSSMLSQQEILTGEASASYI